ncbi:MAG: polyamine aminopropyltransferase [Eubacteriales bacterium]|nr:polyamine aminopropyltransferase [Bacillota bacterium]MBV1728065.1 polyamine aminopropyltransferase [Desulforudis sp.]MDQ7788743.1 polyamine aminopropyltransferase [Clostridia bacterium]MDZ4043569.1 polyamine aminopropyltransferase [Eubacteriales bacterium]MBU4532503.1 polyamine aminopropyltransferase [Bacillota bacterium]
MDLWFTEKQSDFLATSYRVRRTLHAEQTPFQDLAVLDTVPFGRMLVLDGFVQTTIGDEFIYHEMITHVPLNSHPAPKKVLIIGGGDGGTMREVVKHSAVEKCIQVEIDERVVEVSKQYLPEIACGFESPKGELIIDDGIKYVQDHPDTFDVIIIDSTDPVGPAVGLFSREFYASVHRALKEDGLFVAQSESPNDELKLIARINRDLRELFGLSRTYLAHIQTYPGTMWSFTIGSKKYDPKKVDPAKIEEIKGLRYYTPELHVGAFVLPRFVLDGLKEQG